MRFVNGYMATGIQVKCSFYVLYVSLLVIIVDFVTMAGAVV